MTDYRTAVGELIANVEVDGAAKAAKLGGKLRKGKDLTKRLRGWAAHVADTTVFDTRFLSALAKMPAGQKDTDDARKVVRLSHHFIRQIATEHTASAPSA